jgi:hypothetical protein
MTTIRVPESAAIRLDDDRPDGSHLLLGACITMWEGNEE